MRIDKNFIKDLAKTLDNFHYESIVTMMIGVSVYDSPIVNYAQIKHNIAKFDKRTQDIILFWYTGDAKPVETISSFLGEKLFNYLYDIDLLNYDEEFCWLNNFLIIPYLNCYFVVSNTPNYPTCQDNNPCPYIGPDSYWLARRVVNKVHGKVLDLCTGSGIQAILSAKQAESVVAVDIDKTALEIAKFNAILNNVDDRIDFRCGNLYEVLDSEKFDYILSNPPFVPIPEEVDFSICGDGGESGKDLINFILNGYKKYLSPGGMGIMVGQALGNDLYTFLEDDIKVYCKDMKASLMLWGNAPITSLVGQTMMLAKQRNINNDLPFDVWKNRFTSKGASVLYTFTLFVTNCEGCLSTVYSKDNWNETDVPVTGLHKVEKVGECFNLLFNEGISYICDDEQKYFIEQIDGTRTVKDIVDSFPLRYKVKHNISEWGLSLSYLTLCGTLERMGILKKERRMDN